MGKGPVEVVQDVYGAFGRGDIEGLLALLASDVVWDMTGPREYPVFGRRTGRDGALAFFQAVGANEDISEFVPERFLPSGDTVAVQGRVAMKLKSNGEPVTYDWVHLWHIRDGRVAAMKGFPDSAAVLDAYRR